MCRGVDTRQRDAGRMEWAGLDLLNVCNAELKITASRKFKVLM